EWERDGERAVRIAGRREVAQDRSDVRRRARANDADAGAAERAFAQPDPRVADLGERGDVRLAADASVAEIAIERGGTRAEGVERSGSDERDVGRGDEHHLRRAAPAEASEHAVDEVDAWRDDVVAQRSVVSEGGGKGTRLRDAADA